MSTRCSVKGCGSPYLGKSFFSLPAILKFKYSREKVELSKKRRTLWLEALGIQNDDPDAKIRVCSDHFLTGRPAALEDPSDIDWVPSLHMKLPILTPAKRPRGRPSKKFKAATSLQASPVSSKDNTKNINQRKSLNCKVVLDGNLRCNSFNGTNGSGLAIIQKHGKFTSDNITLRETAINNTVLRVRVIREDLLELKRRYTSIKQKRKAVSSFGRQIKKKSKMVYDDPVYSRVNVQSYNRASPNLKVNKGLSEDKDMYNTDYLIKNSSGDKSTLHNKLQGKHAPPKNSLENAKTLNRVIKRNDKDKIRVKFFPKTSTPIRRTIKNGTIQEVAKPLALHREILFVNQYKNPLLLPQGAPETPELTYYLKFSHNQRSYTDGILSYPFQKLVMDVKHMKLPGPNWKIKVIIRKGRISAITFTNKMPQERCISFSANSSVYNIMIDNKPVLLLGSPQQLRSSNDLEVLMDIVENIDPNNPMILYK